MLFHSVEFLMLLLVTFSLYYLSIFRRFQVALLVGASFTFYGFHQPMQLLLLVICILANTVLSYLIHQSASITRKKLLLTGSIVSNILLLCFFKYGTGIANYFIDVSTSPHNTVTNLLLAIPLPLGISFYTFEAISLLVDIYKNKEVMVDKKTNFPQHLMYTSFFISFFPHLIAGPILKASNFFPQIVTKKWAAIDWAGVIHYLILGYFLKMVVADNLKDLTNIIVFPYFQAYSTYSLLLAILGFSIEMFADFAGYSLIAVGLGLLFGYSLPQNFNFPYIATSFIDFWQRWHISLSSWLKEYVYIPLGGNRKGVNRTYINIILVMLVGGLWHGSSWTYALWGGTHGLLLIIEKKYFTPTKTIARKMIGWMVVFLLVSLLWVLFKLPNIHHFYLFFIALLKNIDKPIVKLGNQFEILIYAFPIALYHLRHILFQHSLTKSYMHRLLFLKPFIYGVMIFLIIVNSGDAGKFIYFQF